MFTFIDLFAGIGGFRIAMERQGGKCVFGSEIDKHAVATYEKNFGEKPAGDITQIEAKDVPDHDVLCGGFPCQPFSVSGKQLGWQDARGTLFFEIMRIVSEKRPKAVFLENVKNYVGHRGGETLKRTIEMLEVAGYRTKWSVINASDFGMPQARKRCYFVGIREDITEDEFNFPEPTHEEVSLRNFLVSNDEAASVVIERDDIKFTKEDVASLAAKKKNKPIQIGVISKGGQGERIYSTHGHAITLSAHGGGAASKTGAYLVDGKVRRLHPIECRRVMGFPDDFEVDGRKAQAYKQFGNAVVVPVVEAIGKKIVETLGQAQGEQASTGSSSHNEKMHVHSTVKKSVRQAQDEAAPKKKVKKVKTAASGSKGTALLGHEKLAAYQDAITFVGWTEELFDDLSKAGSLKKDLEKASNRMPVYIAEGASKPFGRGRANAWQTALSMALESAANLDVLVGRGLAKKKDVAEGKVLLAKIAKDLELLLNEQPSSDSGELELGY